MKKIRVVVVDDHRLVRDSLRRTLEDAGIHVVGEAGDGVEAIELVTSLRPHVVLMDVTMPTMDGLVAARRLRSLAPDTRIVMLTMHDEPELIDRARAAGVSGYLFKDLAVDEVVGAVQRAAAGGLVIGTGVPKGPWIEERVRCVAGSGDTQVLSERESQLLQLVADGVATGDIADRLTISPKTVRNHLSRIYSKLGVGSRSEAIVAGLRAELIRLD